MENLSATILQIDDSLDYTSLTERAIRKIATRSNVITFYDEQQALMHLERCGRELPLPDLVLLDRKLDRIDGLVVLAMLRKESHLVGLPVLMVSGGDDPEHVERAADLGAGWLVKPPMRNGYDGFARQVLSHVLGRKEIVRNACDQTQPAVSLLTLAGLSSPPMMNLTLPDPSALAAAAPLISKEPLHVLMSCNEAGIDLALLTDSTCKEDIVNTKRKSFARCMMALGYANAQLRRYLPFSDAWYEKRRAEVRKSYGNRTARLN